VHSAWALSRADRRRFDGGQFAAPDAAEQAAATCGGKHLTECHDCTKYRAEIRATIAIAGRVTPDDLTEQMRVEFVALYRRSQLDRDARD
jgi:hypothetical protein